MSAQDPEQPPGTDVFGAPWPEDPRLQEQQTLGEPTTESEPEGFRGPSGGTGPAATPSPIRKDGDASGFDHDPARSSVKLSRNTRGVNWDVKVMAGDSEAVLDEARRIAVAQHRALEEQFSG
jgi:hypothetical protein